MIQVSSQWLLIHVSRWLYTCPERLLLVQQCGEVDVHERGPLPEHTAGGYLDPPGWQLNIGWLHAPPRARRVADEALSELVHGSSVSPYRTIVAVRKRRSIRESPSPCRGRTAEL